MSGPGYAALLVVSLVGASILKSRAVSGRWRPVDGKRATMLMVLPAIVLAAPWYIRNLFYFHNPLYPQKVTVFGRTIFLGPLDERFFAPLTLRFDFVRLFEYWRRFIEGLGVALPILLAAPLMILLLCYLRHWKKEEKGILLWLVLLPILLLLLYMQQPFSLLQTGVDSWEVQPRF